MYIHCIVDSILGKLGYARWLTVANRILRHYVSFSDPTANLILMENFVINVYAKAWFSIKTKSLFTDSPTHVFNMIQNAVQLDDSRVSEVMFRVIENNSLALRSENLLCAMLPDSRPDIRSQAIEKILDIRKKFSARDFRKFIKPSNINFQANDYYELIGKDNWLESILTDEYLSEYLESVLDSSEPFSFPKFPCHTQSVERHLRLVSETFSMIADQKLRDSRINITLAKRELMPKFIIRKDFDLS